MTIQRVPVCDVCGNQRRKTHRYQVHRLPDGKAGRHRVVDLCDEHAATATIQEIFNLPRKLTQDDERRFDSLADLRRAVRSGKA